MPNYWQQPKAELVRQKNERGIAVPSTAPTHADLVHALQAADRNPQSFLTLPSEMRVMIYEELLVFKSGKRTCHPQILATNKLIRTEASQILYGKNVIQLDISSQHVELHGERRAEFDRKDWVENLTWPDFLCRAQQIQITVTPPITPQMNARLNNILYSLCGFLAGDHQVKQLTLDIRSMNLTAESDLYRTIIAPLAILKCSKEMRILVADDKVLSAPVHRMDDKTNYLHHRGFPWKRGINTWKELQELAHLTQSSILTSGPQQVNWADSAQRQFYNARSDLQELLKGGQYFNSSWEGKVGIAAGLVRGHLSSFNVPAVIKEQEENIRKAQ